MADSMPAAVRASYEAWAKDAVAEAIALAEPGPKLSPAEDRQLTQAYIDTCRHWNDGHGLIVHRGLAKHLKAMGIDTGYTVSSSCFEKP